MCLRITVPPSDEMIVGILKKLAPFTVSPMCIKYSIAASVKQNIVSLSTGLPP